MRHIAGSIDIHIRVTAQNGSLRVIRISGYAAQICRRRSYLRAGLSLAASRASATAGHSTRRTLKIILSLRSAFFVRTAENTDILQYSAVGQIARRTAGI